MKSSKHKIFCATYYYPLGPLCVQFCKISVFSADALTSLFKKKLAHVFDSNKTFLRFGSDLKSVSINLNLLLLKSMNLSLVLFKNNSFIITSILFRLAMNVSSFVTKYKRYLGRSYIKFPAMLRLTKFSKRSKQLRVKVSMILSCKFRSCSWFMFSKIPRPVVVSPENQMTNDFRFGKTFPIPYGKKVVLQFIINNSSLGLSNDFGSIVVAIVVIVLLETDVPLTPVDVVTLFDGFKVVITEVDVVLAAEVTFDVSTVEFTATVSGAPVVPLTINAIVTAAGGKVVDKVVVGGAVGGRNSKAVQFPGRVACSS